MTRLTIDEYLMSMAEVASKRSICTRHQIGAILAFEGQIISTGYNGPPKGFTHEFCTPCIKDAEGIESNKGHSLCPAVHAEANAICQAAYHGITTRNSTLYTTHYPCDLCQRLIINAGIKRVVYKHDYKTCYTMFDSVNVKV